MYQVLLLIHKMLKKMIVLYIILYIFDKNIILNIMKEEN